jgi:Icc-related predicted phosphoesterase
MNNSLRILGMADLHDRAEMLSRVNDIQADLIAFCGDLHNGSSAAEARPAAKALAGLGLPVLIVPGNMDHRNVVPEIWKSVGFRMMHCASFQSGKYGFLGMGGMTVKSPQRLADPARYYHEDEDVYRTLTKICKEISSSAHQIVMVHQPPRNSRDKIYSGEHTGCISLRRFIEEIQPDLLLCGHIHEDWGEDRIGRTIVVNVGEMRRGYAALIELNDKIKVQWMKP